ncbi:MAG: class I SAM-dependent methyltransferase [Thermoflexales bacterium]|nr:class I SAM-dependent methyltransferase [Thermoflexales bacterium]
MACCSAYAHTFNHRVAALDLARYRKFGPSRATKVMLELVQRACSPQGKQVLDIGAGVGAAHLELLKAGAASAIDVDGSQAYLEAARSEAQRLGFVERVTYRYADFVEVASEIPEVDLVLLDRAICCYPDMPALVGAASQKARCAMGLVWPRENRWVRLGVALFNLFERVFVPCPLMVYVHPSAQVDVVAAQQGLGLYAHRAVGFWQVRAYARTL